MWNDYQWFVIIGGFFSFGMSWGIGANDVANSFATSIGAKTLTLFQACCIAACLEFLGSITLGGEVSKTIASSIAKIDVYKNDPEFFAYGMLCSLLSAAIWVLIASYKGLAVSTTHSIIGSVIGFTLVWKGADAVIWVQTTDEFPFVKGIIPIIISWFTSPILSCIISSLIFSGNRYFILRNKNSAKIAYYALPPLVLMTVFINLFFILYKGAKAELGWDANKAAWVSSIIAIGTSLLSGIVGIPLIKWRMRHKLNRTDPIMGIEVEIPDNKSKNALLELVNIIDNNKDKDKDKDKDKSNIISSVLFAGVYQDIKNKDMNVEVFSEETENIYKYLQVFSSCCVAFAHGANDVANAIGPYAAIWHVYENSALSNTVTTPKWMLALGGAGIVIGLWTYGYKVIQSLGGELCALTPSRGYSAELSTALTVSFASVYGIPISTTHCIVGAELGIGMLENVKTGVNWRLFAKTFSAWVFTLIITGLLSATLFSQGIYSPSKQMLTDLTYYENNIKTLIYENNNITFNQTPYIEPSILVTYLNKSLNT
jgi:sodium-dependent phosphate transporter